MGFPSGLAGVPAPYHGSPAWSPQPRPQQPWPSQPWPSQSRPSQPWPPSTGLSGSVSRMPPVAAPTRTPYAFAKAFGCATVIYVIATGLLFAVLLRQLPSEATAWQLGNVTSRATTAFLIASIVPAFITGVIVHWSARAWPLWQVALTFLPMFFLVAAIQLVATALR